MPNQMIERIEKIVKDRVLNSPIAGDWDKTHAIFVNEKVCESISSSLYTQIVQPLEKQLTKSKAINKELRGACKSALYDIEWQSPEEDEVWKTINQALTNACLEGEGT